MPVLGEIKAEPILPKAAVFDALEYCVYAEEVKRFHESTAAIRIPVAPARSSKSFSAAVEVVFRALHHKPLVGSLQWIVGLDYPTNKEFQYVWKWLVEDSQRWTMGGKKLVVDKAINNPTNGSMVIVLDLGIGPHGRARAVIEGKSASNERALQGEHVTQAILSEAAEHPSVIWEKYLRTRTTWAIFPTTPKPSGEWLRSLCEEGEKNQALGIESFTFPYWSNPLYDVGIFRREEIRAARRTESGRAEDDPYFAEQFLGRWVYYTGLVLSLREENLVDFDPDWLSVSRIFVSCDYGYEDACVALFWAQLPSGALLLWDEIYERHMLTQDFVAAIHEKLAPFKSQVDYVVGDPKQPQVAQYMNLMGLNVNNINKRTQSDRAMGHRRLVDLLAVDPSRGHPMLFICRDRCQDTVIEWKHLRYKDKHSNEYAAASLEGEDHAYDAARYFVTTMPEPSAPKQTQDWLRVMEREQRQRSWSGGGRVTEQLARRVSLV